MTPRFPLMSLSRLRMEIDGAGVTTLAAAHGCPLKCAYCLNPQCHDAAQPVEKLTPQELYARAAVDDLYFCATGGGVTFGGGEPLCHAAFIAAFAELCKDRWRLTVETALNVPWENVRTAAEAVQDWIVDIKDMNPDIYRAYTGMDNARVKENLHKLLLCAGAEHVLVRVPLIPEYNTPEDTQRSVRELQEMGVKHMDCFTYTVNERTRGNGLSGGKRPRD